MMKPIFIRQITDTHKKNRSWNSGVSATKENYTTLYFPDKSSWEMRSSLFAALKKLPEGMFVRINDSTAVSVYHIDNIRNYLVLVGSRRAQGNQDHWEAIF